MIYYLSNINRSGIKKAIEGLFQKINSSFREEPTGSFLNCFLVVLCTILMLLSTNHSLQMKPSALATSIVDMNQSHGSLTKKAVRPDENMMVNKLADEASKNSSTNYLEVKQNIADIIESLNKKQIATPRVIAYAIATTEKETGNTFKPIEEYGGPQQAIALGYSGGERYYGRGYIQITHDYNYQQFGEKIGMGDRLVANPELALQPKIASDILAEFFKDNDVAAKAEEDFVAARQPINGSDHAEDIAYEAERYLQTIEQANTDAIAYNK
jgi:predicted chitinase